jgi:osmotically-inducible protein OsmY
MPDVDRTEEYAREAREPQGYRRTDEEMAREICERLADDVGLDAGGVYVEVRQGEATLHGVVRHCADIPRAERHACAVVGVTCVRNDLTARETSEQARRPAVVGAASKMGKPTYEA